MKKTNKLNILLLLIVFLTSILSVVAVPDACPGAVIADLTLTNDLEGVGSCIELQANAITIDCAGYNITYNTAGGSNQYGIYSSLSRNNITIKNCVVQDGNGTSGSANWPIWLEGGNDNIIENNTVYFGPTNDYGIRIRISVRPTVRNNVVIGTGLLALDTGIYMYRNNLAQIYGNDVVVSGPGTFSAIRSEVIGNTDNDYSNVSDNTITLAGGALSTGVEFLNPRGTDIKGNTITGVNGIYAGIVRLGGAPSQPVYIEDNTINFTNILFGLVLGVQDSGTGTIINNNIYIEGSQQGYGLFFAGAINSLTVQENNITVITPGQFSRAFFSNAGTSNSLIDSNNVYLEADSAEAFRITGGGSNNVISNNIVDLTSSGAWRWGAWFEDLQDTLITGNDFKYVDIEGSSSDNLTFIDNHALEYIKIDGANNNLFTNTIISGVDAKLEIEDSNVNVFNGLTIDRSSGSSPYVTLTPTSLPTGATFNNLKLKLANGEVLFNSLIDLSNVSSTETITVNDVTITGDTVRVNTTSSPYLNIPAILTFYLVDKNPEKIAPFIDHNDDGSFEECPYSICRNRDYTGTTYTFSVDHFTTYKVSETYYTQTVEGIEDALLYILGAFALVVLLIAAMFLMVVINGNMAAFELIIPAIIACAVGFSILSVILVVVMRALTGV